MTSQRRRLFKRRFTQRHGNFFEALENCVRGPAKAYFQPRAETLRTSDAKEIKQGRSPKVSEELKSPSESAILRQAAHYDMSIKEGGVTAPADHSKTGVLEDSKQKQLEKAVKLGFAALAGGIIAGILGLVAGELSGQLSIERTLNGAPTEHSTSIPTSTSMMALQRH